MGRTANEAESGLRLPPPRPCRMEGSARGTTGRFLRQWIKRERITERNMAAPAPGTTIRLTPACGVRRAGMSSSVSATTTDGFPLRWRVRECCSLRSWQRSHSRGWRNDRVRRTHIGRVDGAVEAPVLVIGIFSAVPLYSVAAASRGRPRSFRRPGPGGGRLIVTMAFTFHPSGLKASFTAAVDRRLVAVLVDPGLGDALPVGGATSRRHGNAVSWALRPLIVGGQCRSRPGRHRDAPGPVWASCRSVTMCCRRMGPSHHDIR
jgi:hypothetical protein